MNYLPENFESEDNSVEFIREIFDAINEGMGDDVHGPISPIVLDELIDSLVNEDHKMLAVMEQSSRCRGGA